MVENFDFPNPKFNFVVKIQLLTKNSILAQKFKICPEIECLAENSMFEQQFNFRPKSQFLTKKFDF